MACTGVRVDGAHAGLGAAQQGAAGQGRAGPGNARQGFWGGWRASGFEPPAPTQDTAWLGKAGQRGAWPG